MIFTHQLCVLLTLFALCWWPHNLFDIESWDPTVVMGVYEKWLIRCRFYSRSYSWPIIEESHFLFCTHELSYDPMMNQLVKLYPLPHTLHHWNGVLSEKQSILWHDIQSENALLYEMVSHSGDRWPPRFITTISSFLSHHRDLFYWTFGAWSKKLMSSFWKHILILSPSYTHLHIAQKCHDDLRKYLVVSQPRVIFFQKFILISNVVHHKDNLSEWNWCNAIYIVYEAISIVETDKIR